MDLGSILQLILFGAFGIVTAALTLGLAPTYNNLVVPELAPAQLYPPLSDPGSGAPTYLAQAAHFSNYLLVNIVDPAVALVAVGLGLIFLSRAVWTHSGLWTEGLFARFVIAIVLANFAVPLAGGILDLGAATYPTVAGWDGGAWQSWTNLAGTGEFAFSSQNGALTFVLAFVQFSIVILLAIVIGLRDATLAMLLVLLPIFTLVWPIRPLSVLARRGWLLFVELAFLPCILVIPLELAVGSPSVILLVAYLTLALASPYFLSISGTHLTQIGFPSAGSALSGGVERGMAAGARTVSSGLGGLATPAGGGGGAIGGAIAGGARAVGSSSLAGAGPLAVADAIGRGTGHLARHIRDLKSNQPKFDPYGRGGHG
ncbi:MAG: hypothetical protein ACREB9_01075 [Thermoplasmata archaeon]